MNTRSLIAAAVLSGLAISASAEVVTVKYTGSGKGQNIKINLDGDSSTVFSGQLYHQLSGASGLNTYLNGTWTTFCTDLTEYVSGSNKSFNLVTVDQLMAARPNASGKANALRALFGSAGNTAISPAASNNEATAFQIAVWEIITDFDASKPNNGLNITSGLFSAKQTNNSALASGITSLISSYFGVVGAATADDGSLVGIMRSGNQDQIIKVPTPGSLALLGLSGTLAFSRKRRKA